MLDNIEALIGDGIGNSIFLVSCILFGLLIGAVIKGKIKLHQSFDVLLANSDALLRQGNIARWNYIRRLAEYHNKPINVPSDLSNLDLARIDLRHLRITGTSFNKSRAHNADFRFAELQNCTFKGTKLNSSRFDDSTVSDIDFTVADVNNASFRRVDTGTAKFTREQLESVDTGKHLYNSIDPLITCDEKDRILDTASPAQIEDLVKLYLEGQGMKEFVAPSQSDGDVDFFACSKSQESVEERIGVICVPGSSDETLDQDDLDAAFGRCWSVVADKYVFATNSRVSQAGKNKYGGTNRFSVIDGEQLQRWLSLLRQSTVAD